MWRGGGGGGQNLSISYLKLSCLSHGEGSVKDRTREAVGLGGGTASLPRPIKNAPNPNDAGIPTLTCEDGPIEIVSLYVPFW